MLLGHNYETATDTVAKKPNVNLLNGATIVAIRLTHQRVVTVAFMYFQEFGRMFPF